MGSVGRRYARAVLSIAVDQSRVDAMVDELSALAQAWNASAELRGVLENPVYPSSVRVAVLRELGERLRLSVEVRNLLLILETRHRMRSLPDIAAALRELADEQQKRIRAAVTSAGPLPDAYFLQLKASLEKASGHSVVMTQTVDPTLIAGVVTRVGDRVFDGSLRTRLDDLREKMLAEQ